MQIWWRGGAYFVLVFSVGFVLGAVRVLFVAPVIGEATAEILEAPLMVFASFVAARFVVRRFPAIERSAYVYSGLFALGLLLVFEFTVVLRVRGMTIAEYSDSRDPWAVAVYVLSLALFAAMPRAVARRSAGASE